VGLDATPLALPVDAGVQTFTFSFDAFNDNEVAAFEGLAGQFFSFGVPDDVFAQIGVYVLDDQGTPDFAEDDTFELLTRHESSIFDDPEPGDAFSVFQAFELPEDGTYFIQLSPETAALSLNDPFNVELTLASVPLEIEAGLPVGERIAYINNEDNVPTQVVYLNFNGGTSTDTFLGEVNVAAFNASLLDPTLSSVDTSTLIEGDALLGVTGIVDNILSIYRNTPPDHPDGQINVQRVSAGDLAVGDVNGDTVFDVVDLFDTLGAGLYFTTDDPRAAGLAEEDFTELFIGETDAFFPGLLGLASTVDFANLSKGDEALVLLESFSSDLSPSPARVDKLNEFSVALHTLGLNHTELLLQPDDPDNDPLTLNDPVIDYGDPDDPDDDQVILTNISLITAGPNAAFPEDVSSDLWVLGTSVVEQDELAPIEFNGEQLNAIDQVQQLLWWLT